ncbi:hypothetical protein B0H14DRAFT_3884161 [Mycena olivaceomarginata]|nr:hypothetical protein B0H14DRAFT_3884161 [Mycena olivaceomarginata]
MPSSEHEPAPECLAGTSIAPLPIPYFSLLLPPRRARACTRAQQPHTSQSIRAPFRFWIRNTITARGMAGAQAAETVYGNDCGYAVDKGTDGYRPRVSPSCVIASCGARRARLPSSHELGVVLLPAFPSSAPRRTCGGAASGEFGEARSRKGETAVDVPEMGSTEPRTGGVGDEEMRGGQVYMEHQAGRGAGVVEVQGGVGVDGEKSPPAAWCTMRATPAIIGAGTLARRHCIQGRAGEACATSGQWSALEADEDRLAEDQRLGRESEADADKPRSGTILARASIPQYEARAHPLPTRVFPIHTPLGSPSRTSSPHRPPLAPLTHTHRCGSSHTSRRSGVDAHDAPLEFADSRQNALKVVQTLCTADEVSPATRCG